jgi:hypothetical protein
MGHSESGAPGLEEGRVRPRRSTWWQDLMCEMESAHRSSCYVRHISICG